MFTPASLLNTRLHCQQITSHRFGDAGTLISHMCAMQAQDYTAAKWAFGVRLPSTSDEQVEQEIADKRIIRTWALRGTLHFTGPDDIHWLLGLIRPRLASIYASYYRNLDLTATVIRKSQAIMEKILDRDKRLTRTEITAALEAKKIKTTDMRINFLLLRAALDGLICFGERKDKQFTFVLLDQWITRGRQLSGLEAIAELTQRYFRSHGPATIQDFGWWSGLTQTDIQKGISALGKQLKKTTFDSREYIMDVTCEPVNTRSSVYLLPAFDEYLVGYKERKQMLATEHTRKAIGVNGIFYPMIVVNGKIVGIWKRKSAKQGMILEKTMFEDVSKLTGKKINKEAKMIAGFYNAKLLTESM